MYLTKLWRVSLKKFLNLLKLIAVRLCAMFQFMKPRFREKLGFSYRAVQLTLWAIPTIFLGLYFTEFCLTVAQMNERGSFERVSITFVATLGLVVTLLASLYLLLFAIGCLILFWIFLLLLVYHLRTARK